MLLGSVGLPFALLSGSASRCRSALPVDRRVFPQGRLLHRALLEAMERLPRERTASERSEISLLPLDLDGDRFLDHELLWSPAGLKEDALRVLRSSLQAGRGDKIWEIDLVAAGEAEILRAKFYGLASVLGPAGGTTQWCSA